MADMFDLEDKTKGPEQPKEPEQPKQPTQDEIPPNGRYILQNVVPMFPGWVACYDDPESDTDGVISFPIVALGMVLLQHPDGRAEQTVRHLVSTAAGQVDDINEFSNFICVVAPGQEAQPIIAAMRKMRDNAATAS
jgi:hypothetical protein